MFRLYAERIEFDPDAAAQREVYELLADRADPAFWLDAYFDSFGETR